MVLKDRHAGAAHIVERGGRWDEIERGVSDGDQSAAVAQDLLGRTSSGS